MTDDSQTVHALYKKLLTLYPREFKERLGESMEQSFNDLYKEWQRQTDHGLFGFILLMFTETAIGIAREHLLLITEGNAMKNIFTAVRSPALISIILVVPFMIMEFVNRRSFNEDFPVPLFIIMWLLPMIFVLTMMPVVRNVRAGHSLLVNPVILLLRVVFWAFLIWAWFGIVIDQMPCFLGVPNCD